MLPICTEPWLSLVEGARLKNGKARKGLGGSNPSGWYYFTLSLLFVKHLEDLARS
jgi:hypothetical protein